MTEDEFRSAVAAHDEAVKLAIDLVRQHGGEISRFGYHGFQPSAEEGVRLSISGETATLYFTADGYDGDYASSVDFPAAMLWDRSAVAAAIREARARRDSERAESQRQQQARERAQYEALKRKFG